MVRLAAFTDAQARRDARLGGALSLAAALVWLFQAAVIAAVLAGILTGESPFSPLAAAALYFALAALRSAVDTAAQHRLSRAADTILTDLRLRIVATEARTAAPSVIGDGGALAALTAEKLDALRPWLLRYRPARLRSAVVIPIILALSFWHSWAVGVVLLAAGPLIPVFMALVGWAAREASARQMGEVGQLSDLLVDRLVALADLRLVGAGPAVVESFHTASETLRARTMAVLRIAFLSSTVLELFAALGVAMVAVWTGFSLLGAIGWGTWGAPLTPFAGIYLLLLAPEYFQPLRDLAAAWHDRAAADAVIDEVETWQGEVRPGLTGLHVPAGAPLTGPIHLDGVAVARGARLIRYPDLTVAPGESLAVTGPSGSGKTTLLRLLAGLERPAEGTLRIDGTPLTEANISSWRAGLGWMPQAPHFLSRSLRYNIAFDAPLDPWAMTRAALDPVLAGLPAGLDTPLGELGAGLSGGEARRVMLARALNGSPAVLLADEPTADLDAATARTVTDALIAFAQAGGTLIVATHDETLMDRLGRRIDLGKPLE
ncbi:MAG: ATP-binding cassette domain-containing protein [Maritimibacter sp.]|nr:ATP-binding cassette domain-containing protein [Maritimibacter sp.]